VQTLGAVREFQVPAQARPPLDTVTMLGALDWNEKVSVKRFPAEFCADAPKDTNFPTSRDTFGPGVMLTTAGISFLVTWVEVPPPQEARRKQPKTPKTEQARDLTAETLPMNTFQEEMNQTCSGKLSV
jgi:hypothetical protein